MGIKFKATPLLIGLLLLALFMVTACGSDEEPEQVSPPSPPAAPTTASPTPPQAVPPSPSPVARTEGLPQLIVFSELFETDLRTGQPAFAVDVEAQYSDNPKAALVSVNPNLTVEDFGDLVRSNLQHLAEEGVSTVEVPVIGGYGTVFLDSPVLLAKRQPGFDYDRQYIGEPREDELRVPEEEARERYRSLPEMFPLIVQEAHALGLKVFANIESLAHIINRASASGTGGGASEMVIAGYLPPPTVDEVLRFVDDVLATGPDGISAEAYPEEYDKAIAKHLRARGVLYKHSGTDLGGLWAGYYYALYPDSWQTLAAYQYLITADSIVGTTNGSVFAVARAATPLPRTAVVVGAYTPFPCDTSISVTDLYSTTRSRPEDLPIDPEEPALPDGTSVENCTTGTWANLALVGVRRQGVDTVEVTADLKPSAEAIAQPGFLRAILDRLAAHPAVEDELPTANIIIDRPEYGPDDGVEFMWHVGDSLVGPVDDSLQAAGYQTVLTYDHPWAGGRVALTYILTAGGNEDTGDGANLGPPFWTSAQELDQELMPLLDADRHPGPVFIHPVLGVSDLGNWRELRARFGLPQRFAYQNPTLSKYGDYHTSLLSSWTVDAEGNVLENEPQVPITPETGQVLGNALHLLPYGDTTGLGQAANLVGPGEVPADRVVAAGPLRVPGPRGNPEETTAPYLVTDGKGRFLWVINQLHHQALSYIIGQAIAQATGSPPVLAEPTEAHVWSGRQTFALAYDKTEAALNLPFQEGEPIDVTVYSVTGKTVQGARGIPYKGPLHIAMDKYSLLVVEPAR